MQVRLTTDQTNTGQGAASKSWVETRTTVVVVFTRGGLLWSALGVLCVILGCPAGALSTVQKLVGPIVRKV